MAVDTLRIGRTLRELRRRRGWTQLELATRVAVSQQAISLVERGHGATLSLATLARMFGALDGRLDAVVSWRGGNLDRLLDEDHARLVGETVRLLVDDGWLGDVEVTYAYFGERGSIDVLGVRPGTGAMVVVEVKSELTAIEATLRKLDEKQRLVRTVIGPERAGFKPQVVARLLILPDTSAARERVRKAARVLDTALPQRGRDVRHWLRRPVGNLAGILFLPDTNARGDMRRAGGPHRVRRHAPGPEAGASNGNRTGR